MKGMNTDGYEKMIESQNCAKWKAEHKEYIA